MVSISKSEGAPKIFNKVPTMSDLSSDDESYHAGSDSEPETSAPTKFQGDMMVDMSPGNKASKGPIASDSSPNKQGKVQPVEEGLVDIPDIEKSVLNELFLSVQNLGTNNSSGEFVRSEDCFWWLGDIQRVLARDDPDVRHVHDVLGSLNVLPKKLIPIMKQSKDDDSFISCMLKIFVFLTAVTVVFVMSANSSSLYLPLRGQTNPQCSYISTNHIYILSQ
jgi:hypothetical protein